MGFAGELEHLSQNASEGLKNAQPVIAALLEMLQHQESGSFSSAAQAFAEFLQGQMSWIQVSMQKLHTVSCMLTKHVALISGW